MFFFDMNSKYSFFENKKQMFDERSQKRFQFFVLQINHKKFVWMPPYRVRTTVDDGNLKRTADRRRRQARAAKTVRTL